MASTDSQPDREQPRILFHQWMALALAALGTSMGSGGVGAAFVLARESEGHMHAIIVALAGIACMSIVGIIALLLWQLPRPDHARAPTPRAPTPTESTVSRDVTSRSVAMQSRPAVQDPPTQPAPRDDNYVNDKAQTAFFERRPKRDDPNGGGPEVVSARPPASAKQPLAVGLARRKPPSPPPPRNQT